MVPENGPTIGDSDWLDSRDFPLILRSDASWRVLTLPPLLWTQAELHLAFSSGLLGAFMARAELERPLSTVRRYL